MLGQKHVGSKESFNKKILGQNKLFGQKQVWVKIIDLGRKS